LDTCRVPVELGGEGNGLVVVEPAGAVENEPVPHNFLGCAAGAMAGMTGATCPGMIERE
jgi:hypothetical protein